MSGEITKALNDMARDADQCKRLKAENKRYRKALQDIERVTVPVIPTDRDTIISEARDIARKALDGAA